MSGRWDPLRARIRALRRSERSTPASGFGWVQVGRDPDRDEARWNDERHGRQRHRRHRRPPLSLSRWWRPRLRLPKLRLRLPGWRSWRPGALKLHLPSRWRSWRPAAWGLRLPPVRWRSWRPAAWGPWWRRRREWLPRSRLGRVLVALLAVATAGAGLGGIVRSSLLDVDRIGVAGAVTVPADDARRAAGVALGDPLFAVDTSGARAGVEALPKVAAARVTRSFPNLVEILIDERTPTAAVGQPGGFAVVDATGRVLEVTPARPAGLPELIGVGVPPAPGGWLGSAGAALEVLDSFPPAQRTRLVSLTVAGEVVTVNLAGREVRIGRPAQLEAKVSALGVLLERLGPRPVAYLDVRVPSAPVVGPLPGEVPPPPPAPTPEARD